MAKEELVQGSTYIVKYGSSASIFQITVLMITDKLYQFRYENSNTEWIEKRNFERDYSVIENISNFLVQEKIKESDLPFKFATEYETCPVCHGTGNVPNTQKTTAAFVTCPLCQGNKRVIKRTETIV